MKIKVDWDLTDDDFDEEDCLTPELINLATEINVPNDIKEEDISDWLSDNYGWCVNKWQEI